MRGIRIRSQIELKVLPDAVFELHLELFFYYLKEGLRRCYRPWGTRIRGQIRIEVVGFRVTVEKNKLLLKDSPDVVLRPGVRVFQKSLTVDF